MKHIIHKPKSLIPIFAIIILGLSAYAYTRIGIAPTVPANIQIDQSGVTSDQGSNTSLSFSKTGRVEALLVKEGDVVNPGQVLARLSAPDALGAVNQAKGALQLAEAQYASLNNEYATTKAQQDLVVANAYRTLLSSGLEGVPSTQDSHVPIISGTYACDKEGSYELKAYASSDNDSGYTINYSGLEAGTFGVKYDNPVAMGECGLQVKFIKDGGFNTHTTWTVAIPNTKSSVYLTNKNAYDLALVNRDKVLSDLVSRIGTSAGGNSVAKAQVTAAEGSYQAAMGAYQNNLIIAPVRGVVSFIDSELKVGQLITAGKAVISLNQE